MMKSNGNHQVMEKHGFKGFDRPSSLQDPQWKWRDELQQKKNCIESKNHIISNRFGRNLNSSDMMHCNGTRIIQQTLSKNLVKWGCPKYVILFYVFYVDYVYTYCTCSVRILYKHLTYIL